ncbi:SGNH/GDSL hydrolase family protein [Lentisphaerota bacterium ZTH]|nr:SGNH/GDSL hydrolase family protein [Lentisphaerota bacterium]WET05481.1 SGNH/GDSL hydrolase family protein [Lentisphaerota bacterium ZTH]
MIFRGHKQLTIVAFGDSFTETAENKSKISECWLNILEGKLRLQYPEWEFDVYNFGFHGYSDREKMLYFESDVVRYQPDLLFVEFGGSNEGINDVRRYVTPEQTFEYLERIHEAVGQYCRITVITYPRLKAGKSTGKADAVMEKYREKCRDFAENYDLPLIDLAGIMSRDSNPGRLTLNDGLHLSEAGRELLADLAMEVVKSELGAAS